MKADAPRAALLLVLAQALILACSPQGNLASRVGSSEKPGLKADDIPQAGGSLSLIRPEGKTIADRFMPPAGFAWLPAEADSFAAFLRSLPLKPVGTKVRYFDGREKDPDGVYEAVVDLSLGRRDLQQCADAVIRLRAEYLYARRRYGQIQFNFLDDGRPHRYLDFVSGDLSYAALLRYLDTVFDSANTASLAAELVPVGDIRQMQAGDMFISAGRPYGHAVIIVDLAVNPADGRRLFLLAQSYMPAQDIQILKNPNDPALSPWYPADFEGSLVTPEWVFKKTDLKRF